MRYSKRVREARTSVDCIPGGGIQCIVCLYSMTSLRTRSGSLG